MSRLDELIAELCPKGVEYKNLSHVLTIKNGKDYKGYDQGEIPVYGTGGIMTYIDRAAYEKPSVLIPRKGSIGNLYYVDRPFWTVDTIFYTEIKTDLIEPKYVFYYLQARHLEKLNTAGGVPSLTQAVLNTVKIPLPPLPVQQEIVRILDNFTELTADLTAELTARKRQYEYYRNILLNSNHGQFETTLGEICDFVRGPFGGSLKKEIFKNSGYAVYEQQHAIYGEYVFRYFIDEKKYMAMQRFAVKPGDLIMSCSGTMGEISIIPEDAPKGIINQALLKLTPKEGVSNKYLKHSFENAISAQMNAEAQGGAIRNVASVSVLKEIKVNLPPLEEQQRIVAILDRFDTLCNDLTSGLPAEIEARRKQYEYYRDKLLTFKEASE